MVETQPETSLPYSYLGLAYLLYDGGDIEQAVRVIAEWLDCTAPPEATSLATTGTTTLPKACAAIHNVPFGIQFARNTSLLT